jgi:DNA-binding YbaB/EbfC family protein
MGANFKMMRQLQQMQEKLMQTQQALESEEVRGSAGGGAVTVTVNGQQKVVAVELAPEAIDPSEREMLQDLVLAAVNDALDRSRALAADRLGQVTGGLGLPPGLL